MIEDAVWNFTWLVRMCLVRSENRPCGVKFTWLVRTYGASLFLLAHRILRIHRSAHTTLVLNCHVNMQWRKERWTMNDESWTLNDERWEMRDERSDHAEQLCGSLRLCVRAKIISVNFPTGWSESKANRYSVISVISVCNQIREIHVIRGNK